MGIVTIRNILELIISLCGTLQNVVASDESKRGNSDAVVREVIEKFLEKNCTHDDDYDHEHN